MSASGGVAPPVLINNSDAGNILHIQNNDNSNTALIPFKMLGIENYKIWVSAMKPALQARNKYSFVVSTYVYMGLVYSNNVASVWNELEGTYDKVDGSIISNLLQKINNVKQVKCSCDASIEMDLHQQLMKLMQFLMDLNDCYQPITSALLTRDPLHEVKDEYITISKEESHRGVPESSSTDKTKIIRKPSKTDTRTEECARARSQSQKSQPSGKTRGFSKLKVQKSNSRVQDQDGKINTSSEVLIGGNPQGECHVNVKKHTRS
ncbi:ribonuclease H-like domain-containing protein [Tanacetum coccineum]|uniref:Ribonuclease H-like domain-containing protein n=1 Tax=Tanacetum coccineum TaxID=301880 RepID=A0ABQ5BJV6_9ASTR